jgi:hypothetical protein
MSLRPLALTLCAAALFMSTLAAPTNAVAGSSKSKRPKVRMTSPQRGDVFTPGQVVTIAWEYVDANGFPFDPTWCEQEVFLSLDGGQSLALRITPGLDPKVRSYEWTVPNAPTQRAVLDIHYGCEADSFPHEVPNVQLAAPFSILPDRNSAREITLNALPRQIVSGSTLDVSWNSTVEDVVSYEAQVSFDRGGSYSALRSGTDQSISWQVPVEYIGPLVFRVVATTADGSTVESVVDARNVVKVVKGKGTR